MKNKKWLAAVLAAVFCLSGCGAAVHFDEQALMEKSEAYTQALIDGDYASACLLYTSACTGTLTKPCASAIFCPMSTCLLYTSRCV